MSELSIRTTRLVQISIGLAYVLFCFLACRRKPLWFDELFTMLVARLGGPGDVWAHLRAGMDNHPPLGYLLGNLSIRLFGESAFAVRLPSMIGFGTAIVATYYFVARRAQAFGGILAAVLLLSSAGLPLAIEARAYGPVLGLAALSLLAWQSATRDGRSVWSLVGLTLCLAAAPWTHYYSVLLFMPIGLGELVRTWQRRRIDGPVWIALGAAGLLLIPLYLYFVRGSATYASHFWTSVDSPLQVFQVLESLFEMMALPLLLIAVVLLFAPPRRMANSLPSPLPLHEAVASGAFFALPAAMWIMAKVATHAFRDLYVLFAIVGGAAAAALVVAKIWCHGRDSRKWVLRTLLVWLPISLLLQYKAMDSYNPMRNMIKFARETHERLGVDVVFDSNFDYLQYFYYGDAATRAHMYHLMDAKDQLRFNDDDTMVHALSGLGRFTDIQVVDRKAFSRAHPRFAVVSSVRFKHGWILPAILADGQATVTMVREEKPFTAYLVSHP